MDPGCQAEGLYIKNKFIPNSFQEIHLKVQAKRVKITQYEDGCFLDNEFIGQNCLGDNLRAGEDHLVVPKLNSLDKKFNLQCRTLEINMASLFIDSVHKFGDRQGRQIQLLFNPQLAFGIELREKEKFKQVLTDLEFYRTNIPSLIICMSNSIKPFFVYAQMEERDYSLQLKLTIKVISKLLKVLGI